MTTEQNNPTPSEQTETGSEANGTSVETEAVEAGNTLADISDLLSSQEAETPAEDGDGEEAKAEPDTGASPKDAASEGGEEEPKLAPAPEPGKEEQGKGDDLKDLLKEVLAENRKGAEETKPPKEEEYKPHYAPQIPDNLLAALDSDDPQARAQGINVIIGGAMNRVYEDLKKEITAELQTVRQEFPNVIAQQSEAQQAQKAMLDDFYGAFPELGATPKLRKLVSVIAVQTAQGMGKDYKGYTSDFRDKVGAEVRELTGIQPKEPDPNPTAGGKGKKPGTSALPAGSSTRTPVDGTQGLTQEIADIVLN